MPPFADLHCDLLTYLARDEARTAYDAAARASLSQLAAGGVRTQVLAVFAPTDCSALPADALTLGRQQVTAYQRMLDDASDDVRALRLPDDLPGVLAGEDRRIGVVPAIENASTFAGEDEPIRDAFARLESMSEDLGPVLYIGLTWADDNRFGGGNRSRRGLTDDGRRLLDHLAARRHDRHGGPAVDFAHASPWLIDGILEHDARAGSKLPFVVSHTCFRQLVDTPRNVDDDVARAVIARGGILGLNLMRWWNGELAPDCFVAQLRHARTLGIAHAFVFGDVFFCTEDVPEHLRSKSAGDEFFADFGNATCYPQLLECIAEGLDEDPKGLAGLAHVHVEQFIARILDKESDFPIDISSGS